MAEDRGGPYFKEARFFFKGNKTLAKTHVHEARVALGYLRDSIAHGGALTQIKQVTLQDGTIINAKVTNKLYSAEIISSYGGGKKYCLAHNGFYFLAGDNRWYVAYSVDGELHVDPACFKPPIRGGLTWKIKYNGKETWYNAYYEIRNLSSGLPLPISGYSKVWGRGSDDNQEFVSNIIYWNNSIKTTLGNVYGVSRVSTGLVVIHMLSGSPPRHAAYFYPFSNDPPVQLAVTPPLFAYNGILYYGWDSHLFKFSPDGLIGTKFTAGRNPVTNQHEAQWIRLDITDTSGIPIAQFSLAGYPENNVPVPERILSLYPYTSGPDDVVIPYTFADNTGVFAPIKTYTGNSSNIIRIGLIYLENVDGVITPGATKLAFPIPAPNETYQLAGNLSDYKKGFIVYLVYTTFSSGVLRVLTPDTDYEWPISSNYAYAFLGFSTAVYALNDTDFLLDMRSAYNNADIFVNGVHIPGNRNAILFSSKNGASPRTWVEVTDRFPEGSPDGYYSASGEIVLRIWDHVYIQGVENQLYIEGN